jgi:hypothetical protein
MHRKAVLIAHGVTMKLVQTLPSQGLFCDWKLSCIWLIIDKEQNLNAPSTPNLIIDSTGIFYYIDRAN